MTAATKRTAERQLDGPDDQNTYEGDPTMTKRTTLSIHHTTDTAKQQIRAVSRNIRREARKQGFSPRRFRQATGIPFAGFVRLWIGVDFPAWTVLRATATLGVSTETIWGNR
ncbi:hypothetical protein DEI81_07970 [Curtobacterium sp. MCBD17_013]|uniref:hypothetical protein n=1 Tax=Curtobacterium sp. MCBD17_013 TaxID=2175668 RepID=UPI000DA94046|nr:hypothetical protein [Curtobacterium sp. MCBD17_013]PZF63334.1 hypothetical protein DEI81_07970 [Curtobacterium sp. MCBD17_013]